MHIWEMKALMMRKMGKILENLKRKLLESLDFLRRKRKRKKKGKRRRRKIRM